MADIFQQYKDFKAFEVIFLYGREESQKLPCKFNAFEDGNIVIEVSKMSVYKTPEMGDTLKLFVYADSGIYVAESTVMDVRNSMLNTKYLIEYPETTKRYQRREFYRVKMPIDFELESAVSIQVPFKMESSKPTSNGAFKFKGITNNVCGKGIAFTTKEQIDFESVGEINATIYFEERTVKTKAVFVYTRKNPKANLYLHAFSFQDLNQDDVDFIVKKCFLHQLEHRKSGAV